MRAAGLAAFLAAAACGGAAGEGGTAAPAKKKSPPPRQDTVRDVGPDGEGELPMSEVELNMREVRAAVLTCAQETTYEGKVSVRVTIAPSGAASAVIEQGAGEPAVDDCVTAAFGKVTFPTSERGQRFRYSFTF